MKNYQYSESGTENVKNQDEKCRLFLKRFYNDEADYDSATLDDIYKAGDTGIK